MKITVIAVAYHERIFFEYAMNSVLPFVDEVVIVDSAIQSSLDIGLSLTSTDGTRDLIKKYVDNKKIFLAPHTSAVPKTHKECFNLGFTVAKERGADWIFFLPCDEVWPENALKPMRSFLQRCDQNGILGLNVWMHMFAPDFWHVKDFRNPRFSKVTPDCVLADDVTLYYPSINAWQYAGNLIDAVPPGTPDHVQKINGDYPRTLRAYHYSCVGDERVSFKANFWQKHNGTYGDKYVEAYMKKEWHKFKELGFSDFNGKHPDCMLSHPLYSERKF